jgi:predicted transcriptional regulator
MTKKSLNDLRDEMRGVARGDRKPSPLPAREVLSVLSSPELMDLLQVIHQQRPESVGRLAELTGRAQSNVSRSLQQLAKHDLIRLVREGREVRPVPTVVKVSVSLDQGTYEVEPLAA